MPNELKLISPIPPSVNHYLGWRSIYNPKTKKYMAMSYETADAKKYKKEFVEYVKKQVKEQNWIMSDNRFQHYFVDAVFYFPRIDMDCNNYWKCCFDSITESSCVWLDDTQACENVKAIYYDSSNPRIELVIHPVEYIGIFSNHARLVEFESNCVQCCRYKEGKCCILCKAKEGRIQEEICEGVCEKYKETNYN